MYEILAKHADGTLERLTGFDSFTHAERERDDMRADGNEVLWARIERTEGGDDSETADG